MGTQTSSDNRNAFNPVVDGMLQEVRKWEFPHVREHLKFEHGLSDQDTLKLENEYKKFMSALVSEKRYGEMPISEPVDQFWHTHILFTRDYTRFCQAVAGEYIHHTPTSSTAERHSLENAYESVTVPTLTQHFGKLDETLWPKASQVCLGG